jgi:hypothetical protein
MDNIFEILVFAIIIYSFLSPLFKKKKEQQKNLPKQNNQHGSIGTADSIEQSMENEGMAVSGKNADYDILRELENMFKGEIKIPQQQKQKPVEQYDEFKSHEIKDVDLDLVVDKRMQRSVEDKNPIGARKTYDEKIADRKDYSIRQAKIINPKIELEAAEFEQVLSGPRKQRAAITDFNRKLKNPRTVREYILFSEILGKPKALRR